MFRIKKFLLFLLTILSVGALEVSELDKAMHIESYQYSLTMRLDCADIENGIYKTQYKEVGTHGWKEVRIFELIDGNGDNCENHITDLVPNKSYSLRVLHYDYGGNHLKLVSSERVTQTKELEWCNYTDKQYMISSKQKPDNDKTEQNYNDARSVCERQGGHLITVYDEYINQFLVDVCDLREECLIGLKNGIWDSGETYEYTNFVAGADASQCALMSLKWISTDCSISHCFICERNIVDTTTTAGPTTACTAKSWKSNDLLIPVITLAAILLLVTTCWIISLVLLYKMKHNLKRPSPGKGGIYRKKNGTPMDVVDKY